MDNELSKGEIVIYTSEDGNVSLDTKLENDTIWLTQKSMAELFGVKVPAISKHLKNIFNAGELSEEVVISKMETTTSHGAILDKTQTNLTKDSHKAHAKFYGFYFHLLNLQENLQSPIA